MKGHVLHLFLAKNSWCEQGGGGGGGIRCLALASMSRRLLHRRYEMKGGEGNTGLHRCEERNMLRLLNRHEIHINLYRSQLS